MLAKGYNVRLYRFNGCIDSYALLLKSFTFAQQSVCVKNKNRDTVITKLSHDQRYGKQTFFKSANRKSANSWAYSAVANPQILGLIPLLQIRKFRMCGILQVANLLIFIINPKNANPHISANY